MNDDASRAEPSSAAVISLMRRGVNHDKCRVARYERAPVAAAPVVIAPIMHWTHMLGGCYLPAPRVSASASAGVASRRTARDGGLCASERWPSKALGAPCADSRVLRRSVD